MKRIAASAAAPAPHAAWQTGRRWGADGLAWAIAFGGWLGLASLAHGFTAGPFAASAVLALSWMARAATLQWLAPRAAQAPTVALALLASGAATAGAWAALPHGGGLAALLGSAASMGVFLGWVHTAWRLMRESRRAGTAASGGPLTREGAAAAGALLAWAAIGDITDLNGLLHRLIGAVLLGSMSLAAVLIVPAPAMARAERGDAGDDGACAHSLRPFARHRLVWPGEARPGAGQWALPLMLPMMFSLPLMVGLCRNDALGPQALTGLHGLAMVLPALLWRRLATRPGSARIADACCAFVLIGGAALVLLSEPLKHAGWLALAHGAAWSLASAARPPHAASGALAGAGLPPWARGALSAGFLLSCGAALSHWGLASLQFGQVALGLAAALSALKAAGRSRALPARAGVLRPSASHRSRPQPT